MISRPQYLHIPMAIVCNPKLQPLDLQVYGIIHWYSQMEEHKCFASNEKIAKALSCKEREINPKSVSNSISRLEKAGCVQVILKTNRHRTEIIALVADAVVPALQESSESVPSFDGTKETLPSNNGTEYISSLTVPSDNGRENEVVPSNDGRAFHQMMDGVPSNDGHNSNTQEKELNNNSSNEEERYSSVTHLGLFDEEPQPASASPEPIEGEVVQLGKDGKPLKDKQVGSFGNAVINEGMAGLERLLGYKPTKEKLNRIALSNCIRRYGKEETFERMEGAYLACRRDRYAPKIVNYMDLWDKWPDYDVYLARKGNGVRIGGVQSRATYDNVVGGLAL